MFSHVSEYTPELISSIRAHTSSINTFDFLDNECTKIVSGSNDGTILKTNLNNNNNDNRNLNSFKLTSAHKDSICCIKRCSNNKYFLSSSRDSTVRLWPLTSSNDNDNIEQNFNTGNLNNFISMEKFEPIVYKCSTLTVRYVHPSLDGKQFISASDDKTVKLWSSEHVNKLLRTYTGHRNWIRSCKYSTVNENLFSSCGDDGCLFVYDVRCKEKVHEIQSKCNVHFYSLDWYPNDENLIAIGGNDGSVRIYDLRVLKLHQLYAVHNGAVNSVNFHSSGYYLLSSSSDKMMKIFDIIEAKVLFTLSAHSESVNESKFTNNDNNNSAGEFIISVGGDKIINLWKSNLPVDTNDNDYFNVDSDLINDNNSNDAAIDFIKEKISDLNICKSKKIKRKKQQPQQQQKLKLKYPVKLQSKQQQKQKKTVTEQSKIQCKPKLPVNDDNIDNDDDYCYDDDEQNEMLASILDKISLLTKRVTSLESKINILERNFSLQ